MCLICDHFNSGKLTSQEALRNIDEISESIGPEHTREVVVMIINKDIDNLRNEIFCKYEDNYTLDDAIFDMEFTD